MSTPLKEWATAIETAGNGLGQQWTREDDHLINQTPIT